MNKVMRGVLAISCFFALGNIKAQLGRSLVQKMSALNATQRQRGFFIPKRQNDLVLPKGEIIGYQSTVDKNESFFNECRDILTVLETILPVDSRAESASILMEMVREPDPLKREDLYQAYRKKPDMKFPRRKVEWFDLGLPWDIREHVELVHNRIDLVHAIQGGDRYAIVLASDKPLRPQDLKVDL